MLTVALRAALKRRQVARHSKFDRSHQAIFCSLVSHLERDQNWAPPGKRMSRQIIPPQGEERRSPAATLAARNISKAFGPIMVLHDINLAFPSGEIHAVVGENGAGKSTLMKILAGALEPTSGQVLFQNEPVRTGDLRLMERMGIRFIHQELNLAEDLTVLENLFLGEEPVKGFFLDERTMREEGKIVLGRVGANVPLQAKIKDLRVSEKQLVEIAKAIAGRATVLILDEPTAVLTRPEAERLFEIIEASAKAGVAVIYISHRLEEVKRLAHRITVLRDGRLVASEPAERLAPTEIVRFMVGRSLQDLFPEKRPQTNQPSVLDVRNFTVPGHVQDVSFTLCQGEILGFAGLVGAGRTELFEAIVGLRPRSAGSLWQIGQPVKISEYGEALHRLRAVYLPEDRKGKGLVVSFDAQTNFSLLGLRRFGSWFINQAKEERAFRQAIDQFRIRIPDRFLPVNRLSGGNQQKVVLAKILGNDPAIIIFDEPTRGIDVGTKADIYRLIVAMAAEGRSCVVISSELLELIGLCHRVIVMRNGRIAATLAGQEITEDEIMLYATGVKQSQKHEFDPSH